MEKRPRLPAVIFAFCILVAMPPAGRAFGQSLAAPEAVAGGEPLALWAESAFPLQDAEARLKSASGSILARAKGFYLPSAEGVFLYGFLIPVPLRAGSGRGSLEIVHGGGKLERPVEIAAKSYPSEDIPLDKANTGLRTAPDPAKTAESLAFAKIFQTADPTAIFASGKFEKPLAETWRKTSGFGDIRRYLYFGGTSESSVHGGIDLGGKEGTPVRACASGRVVFAARRIVTGNTVVIEHLPGLFSIYMHLSSIEAVEGSIVEAGEQIGRLGSTGLSTGPHLHWELRIGQVSVDPEYWLTRPLLDKESDSGRIKLPIEGR